MPSKKKQTPLQKLGSALNPNTKFKQLVLFIAAFAAVGGGYYLYKSHAQSYTYLFSSKGVSAYACKQYTSAYGGAYNVTFLFTKAASTSPLYYQVTSYRGANATAVNGGNGYYGNTAGSTTASFSTYYGDWGEVWIHDTSSRSSGGTINYVGSPGQAGRISIPTKGWGQIINCNGGTAG